MAILLLFCAGVIGGVFNSLAGGGSFITFPALLLAGVPPVAANATNTFASLPGYVSGAIGFWPDIARTPPSADRLLDHGRCRRLIGAELLLRAVR